MASPRKLAVLVSALALGAFLATELAADTFTLYPSQGVSSPGWNNPSLALGVTQNCTQSMAEDPTGYGGYLDVSGWGSFTIPEGHRIARVSVNGMGRMSGTRMRVSGSVAPSHAMYCPGGFQAGENCWAFFGVPGWNITSYRETWTPRDIASLVVGVQAVVNDFEPRLSSLDGLWVTVETGLCGAVPANSFDFGNRLVGSTTDWSFHIYNAGSGPFSGNVENVGPFEVISGGGHYDLDAGEFRDVVVRYAPQASGDFEATIGPPCGPTLRGSAVFPATDVSNGVTSPGITRVAPQPFAESSSISFGLPSAGMVRLAIHDVRGRRVRTLASRWMPAGEHRLEWNGRDDLGRKVPAGIYFLKLETPARSWTRTIAKVS